jgi:pyridoxamine 5'-phosphate oxidase
MAEWTATFTDGDVPRPPWWGGWRVVPRAYEFWQQGTNRLHDRLRYDLVDEGWRLQRLQP